MYKVNNKKTIHQLAKSSFRANQMRNLFAIVAIILTTVLFTGLFTITGSLLASMEESTMRQVGSSAHGSFKYLNMEQYDKLKMHKSIREISYSVILGVAENKELAKRPTELRYASGEAAAKSTFAMPSTGRLPQKDDEIATDTIVLEHLGIPAEVGQKVLLSYSISGVKHTETFTLSGFWEGDKLMPASMIWFNKGYVEKQLIGYVPSGTEDVMGTINAEVNFANSFNIEGKLLKVLADTGYTEDEIPIGVNWAYTGNSDSVDAGTILSGAVAIAMIIFCGYLMISNIFYICVTKDIHYYGLLKTIGTTGRQIRYLIRRQALLLCTIGVPLGLVVGYLVGAMLTPIILSIFNTNVVKIVISPAAFLLSALFAIVTVVISIAKPSKIAAKVSPIEALRSTDGAQKSKKMVKKNSGIRLWSMAMANVLRNKKKAILVTISLSLSFIILNSAYSMANSFDMDKYLSSRISSDFAIGDVGVFNVHIDYTDQDTLSTEFLAELAGHRGVESMSNIYFAEPMIATDPQIADIPERAEKEFGISGNWLEYMKEAVKSPIQTQHIYGIDEDVMKRLMVYEGELDYAKLQTGNYIIAAPVDETDGQLHYYEVGEEVTVVNEEGKSKEYEVLAIAVLPYNLSIQHRHPIMPEYYMADDEFISSIADKAPMFTTVDVADQYESEMEQYLSNYSENVDTNMQYLSKATLVAEYENTQHTYKSVGMILSLLVAFIGVMNFINTVITSIMSRRRELAMLQSIGMTRKQTQRMFIYEGLVYTILTAVFTLTIGNVIGILGTKALLGDSIYLSSDFTIVPCLVCLPVLTLISVLVPDISGKAMNKNSIVERLREAE